MQGQYADIVSSRSHAFFSVPPDTKMSFTMLITEQRPCGVTLVSSFVSYLFGLSTVPPRLCAVMLSEATVMIIVPNSLCHSRRRRTVLSNTCATKKPTF
ncbi:hypothetical protein TNCV_1505881 [Trichonephila clavipes]|nr:hypothetical protein TNCV_1505881 [Trichonephila clavipes]